LTKRTYTYRNGDIIDQDIATDRGLLYGDGVFTTIAIKEGKARYLELHFQRLLHDCQRLKIDSVPLADIKLAFETSVKNVTDGIARITISRSSGERGYLCVEAKPVYWISISPLPTHLELYSKQGIKVRICEQRLAQNKTLAGIKHCNRLEQVMARNEWHGDQFQEGLMRDTEGNFIEGTMSNLFIIKNQQLLTPDLTFSGVEGIMRRLIISLAQQANIPVNITSIKSRELFSADGAFVTNSVIGIWPICSIEQGAGMKQLAKHPLMVTLQSSVNKLNLTSL